MLADALGAPRERAMEAASFVELYYTMCSFTDDVQDGDAPVYMPDIDAAMHVNIMMQLLCVTVARGCHLARASGDENGLWEMENAFLTGAAMLRGQRYEMTREEWSVDRYRLVAELSAGRQFELYLRMSAIASGVAPELLAPPGVPLGVLVQLKHDMASGDDRLDGLPSEDIGHMYRSALADLEAASSRVPEAARRIIGKMIEVARVDSLEADPGS